MFEKEWFPIANGLYGVTWDEFWRMNPHIINCLHDGYEIKAKVKDEESWMLGQYFMSALDATVCNAILWRKKGSKSHEYIKQPILHDKKIEKEEKGSQLSEEELQKQRELFVAKLEVMKTNFELNHKK